MTPKPVNMFSARRGRVLGVLHVCVCTVRCVPCLCGVCVVLCFVVVFGAVLGGVFGVGGFAFLLGFALAATTWSWLGSKICIECDPISAQQCCFNGTLVCHCRHTRSEAHFILVSVIPF